MTIGKCIDVLGYVSQIARLSTEVAQYVSEPKENPLTPVSSKLNAISKYAILALEALKIFSTDEAMKKRVIAFEISARAVKALSSISELSFDPMAEPIEDTLEKLYAEISGIQRGISEYNSATLKQYLDLSDEELSKIEWPVYECDGPADSRICHIVGYKTKTRDELGGELKTSDTVSTMFGLFESALRGMLCYTYFSRAEPLRDRILLEILDPMPAGGAGNDAAGRIDQVAALEFLRAGERHEGPESMFDFIKFDRIPEELHNDPILAAYIDPITFAPIRYAVTHRLHPQVHYDRLSIYRYIQRTVREGRPVLCPFSRSPLAFEDVVPDEATQNIIDTRLNKLSVSLKAQFAAAIDAAAIAVAE